MTSFNRKLIVLIFILSIIFFILIGLNISPYLRGPGEWPPEWRWPYLFVNTFDRIWLPLIMIFIILSFFYFLQKKKKVSPMFLILLALLAYFFQMAVLYFSRSGIAVLIHRIINPDLNGYFTEAIKLKNLVLFISEYQKNVLSFSMHATGHPPGGIIFFWLIEKIVEAIPAIKNLSLSLSPKHGDVQLIWNSLTIVQRSTAILSALFIPLLSSFNLIPIYYIAKKLYNDKTALRSAVMAIFIPALTLFTPLNDVFLPMFFLWSFYLFISGIQIKNKALLFLSGLIFSLGLFFSLSLLPLIVIFIYFFKYRKYLYFFIFGMSSFYLILFLFKYNVFTTSYTLMTGLPKDRSYLSWLFYNLYDFFVFAGIPISLTYLLMFFKKIKDPLFVSFSLMLFILNLSGNVRGEVGRIWLPLMYPLILIVNNFLTNIIKVSGVYYLLVLFLQAIQILVLQEFWVMLW